MQSETHKLTEFSDKAFALGLSCTHMHADPTSAALFFHAWSAAHRHSVIAFPPFLHPPAFTIRAADTYKLTPPPSYSPLVVTKSTVSPSSSPVSMSSATFLFSSASVRRLLSSMPADTSPFAALASLFWLRIANAKADGNVGPSDITLAIDFRKRMQAPLPLGFYGNAFHFSRAHADLADGVANVAAELDRHVAGIPEDDLWAAVDWLHKNRRNALPPFQMYGPELTCMALDHVPVDIAEFEAGSGSGPKHVSCRISGAEGEGLVVVMLAVEAGEAARTVVITLPADSTAKICKDDGILQYGPTVMFGPKE